MKMLFQNKQVDLIPPPVFAFMSKTHKFPHKINQATGYRKERKCRKGKYFVN